MSEHANEVQENTKDVKKEYATPKVTHFGSVAELTFGGSSANKGK